jgi:hypothetical protein
MKVAEAGSEGHIGSMKVRCKSAWLLHLLPHRPFVGLSNLTNRQYDKRSSGQVPAGMNTTAAGSPRTSHSIFTYSETWTRIGHAGVIVQPRNYEKNSA